MKRPKIIAIVGPTASGKTALSITLAKKLNGEIVSADSRQIYRGMDIGTAKPSPAELQAVPHHLIDIKNPDENYTVAEYKHDAETAITGILKRRHLPILIGGTGLYVRAVLDNLEIPKIQADLKLRKKIEDDIKEKGLGVVFEELVKLDPEAAYIVDPKNPRRVVRALEVAIITGKPFTAQRTQNISHYDTLKLGVNPPPEILRERINLRIDLMIQDGLVDEVQNLIKKYGAECMAFDAIGYREIIDYLKDKISLQKTVDNMKMNTWHYAKRQTTWFRKDKNITWIENIQEAEKLADHFFHS